MSKKEKLLRRLKSRPRDLSWDELETALEGVGYTLLKTGKTGGSRRRFVHETAPAICLHKPHPGNIVKMYAIDDVLNTLVNGGLI